MPPNPNGNDIHELDKFIYLYGLLTGSSYLCLFCLHLMLFAPPAVLPSADDSSGLEWVISPIDDARIGLN
ncbi:MAG: hypothetical protein AAFV95_09280 [Bacteroidota bacterium]